MIIRGVRFISFLMRGVGVSCYSIGTLHARFSRLASCGCELMVRSAVSFGIATMVVWFFFVDFIPILMLLPIVLSRIDA